MSMKYILSILLASATLGAKAQNVKGVVADATDKQPIECANVMLLNEKDSIVGGSLTDNMGRFTIKNTGQKLRISFVGYETLDILLRDFTISDTLFLTKEAITMQGVTVKANRPTVKVGLNKVSVNISNSYLKHLGKITDILKKVPGLSSDLQLLGGGSPTFVLNGKPISLKELSAIPSSEVKKIVVDANPTAEYSASSKGVVYITTVTELGNTLSTELSNTSLFARNYMNIANITINEKYKKVSNLFTAGFSYINTTQIDNTTESVFLPNRIIESTKERHTRGKARAFDWFYAMNWNINNRQTLGIQYSGNVENTHTKEPTWQVMNGENMQYVQRKRGTEYMHNIGLNYHYTLDKNSTLRFVADYAHRKSDDEGLANTNPIVKTNSMGRYNIGGAKLSYNRNAKWGNLSTGIFASAMSNNGGYVYNASGENYKTHETLYGAYASYSKQIKKYSVQLGLRMEADKRKLESETSGVFMDSTEWKIFPNMVVTRTLSNNSSLGLSIGQTIKRPSFSDLSPTLNYYDAISYRVGNPQLNACVTTNFKLSYNLGNFMASVAYNHNKNKIIELPFWKETAVDNKNIEWRPINFNKSSEFVATAIYAYSLGPIQGDISCSYSKPFLKANFLGKERSWNKAYYNFNLSAQCPVSQHSLIALDGSFDSAYSGMLTEHRSSWTLNLTYMHQLWQDRLTLLVVANDIFHTDRSNTWKMEYNNIRTTMNTNGDTQYIMVKLNYNLGKLKLDKNKKTASQDFLNRL